MRNPLSELQEEPIPAPSQREAVVEVDTDVDAGMETGSVTAPEAHLTALLKREAQLRNRDLMVSLAFAASFPTGFCWLAHHLLADETTYRIYLKLLLVVVLGVGGSLPLFLKRRARWRRINLTRTLNQVRDVRQIGLLIQTLRVDSLPVQRLVKQTLIELLPTLKAGDAALLSDSERALLLRCLAISPADTGYRDLRELFSRAAYEREVALRVAILKALEQVGGEKELPAVLRLSRGKTTLQSAAEVPDVVREAALECLPYLESRVQGQRASEQLLRAASAHATPGELLRPAEAISETPADQLLRPLEAGS